MTAVLFLCQASSLIIVSYDRREAAFQDLKYIVQALLYLTMAHAISSEKSRNTVQWGWILYKPVLVAPSYISLFSFPVFFISHFII